MSKPAKDTKMFRLRNIRISRINIDSEPRTSMVDLANGNADMEDLVISVTDESGNDFEVARISVVANGITGESTSAAKLVRERTWANVTGDEFSCPICLFDGHGAGACERK